MSFVDNEIFDNVIVGEYRDNDNKIIHGVFTTKDDGAVVVGINTFEKLLYDAGVIYPMSYEEANDLYGDRIRKEYREYCKAKRAQRGQGVSGVSRQMTFEEADKLYGDRIRKEYQDKLDEQAGIAKQAIKDAHKANLSKARQAKADKAGVDTALIYKLVANGLTKSDIIKTTGFSRSKVETRFRHLRDLNKDVDSEDFDRLCEEIKSSFEKYKAVISTDIAKDRADIYIFVGKNRNNGGCRCSYELRQQRVYEKQVTEEAIKRRVEENHQRILKEAEEGAKELLRGIEAIGYKPLDEIKRPVKSDENTVADIDNVLAMFSGVDTQPQSTPISSVIALSQKDDVNPYIDMYMQRAREDKRREQILPTRHEVYVSADEDE